MNDHPGISNEELHAFIDGELDPARNAEIATIVAADTHLAERIAAYQSDKKQLEHVYERLDARPLPEQWLRLIAARETQPEAASSARVSKRAFAAIAAGLLLILGSWLAYDRLVVPGDEIVGEALAARQESMLPQQSLDVAALAEPEARNQVLTRALTMKLKAPDLSKMGYQLADIRVYFNVPGGKAVELGYRDGQNRVFTLYLRHPSSPARVELLERDGLRICVWQDDVIGTVMLGQMSAGEMARISTLAYAGLTL